MVLTKQEMFSKVRAHLLAQGNKALSPDGKCRYRAPGGLKCAIGCLIPDERYTLSLEGEPVYELECEFLATIGIDDSNIALADTLQGMHDGEPVADWPTGLADIARIYDLEDK